MFKAVIFDIDGTLTRDIAWVYLTEKVGGSIEYNDTTFASLERGEISYEKAKKRLIENWSKGGMGFKNDFERILTEVSLREDAVKTVTYLKRKGFGLCMITGSFNLYAQIVGEKLGIDNWYANTKLIWDDKGKLVDLDTIVDDKKQKIEHLKHYCSSNNFQLNECVPVGDSANDMGLFEITGNGIVVRTEFEAKDLEKIAWKKIDHLAELEKIL